MGLIIYLVGIFVGFLLIFIQLDKEEIRIGDMILLVFASLLSWVLVIMGLIILLIRNWDRRVFK